MSVMIAFIPKMTFFIIGLIMGLILRYATAPTDIESGTVYDCGKLAFSPSTLLINITDQVYEYKYKREISQHNISPHQGNAILEKVRRAPDVVCMYICII